MNSPGCSLNRRPAARTRNLILVQTDARYRATTRLLARDYGWQVIEAGSVPEAARLAKRGAALLVLPAKLPGGESGYLACAKLRFHRKGADCRVVLVTDGPRSAEDERLARFVGAVALVRDAAELKETLFDG